MAPWQVEQAHADHAPMMPQQPPGVVVAPELCYWLHVAALAQLRDETRRDGGGLPAPGLAELLAELRAAASGRAAGRIGTAEAKPVTVAEAAKLAGVSQRRIRQLARSGQIRAWRPGRDWQIDPDSARDWPARR